MYTEARLISSLPIAVTHRYFSVGGKSLHCVVTGSGPALVLLHGLNVGWGMWYRVLPELAKKYTVYALDLPGSGQSSRLDYAYDDIAAHTLAAVDGALRELVPGGATVVAHSIGGWAALKLAAAQHPGIKRLVLTNSMGFTDYVPKFYRLLKYAGWARLVATRFVPFKREKLLEFFKSVMAVGASLDDYLLVDYFMEHAGGVPVAHPILLIRSLLDGGKLRSAFVLSEDELKAVNVPVTIAHGGSDPLIPVHTLQPSAGFLREAKIEILQGVGHVPPIEDPAGFLQTV